VQPLCWHNTGDASFSRKVVTALVALKLLALQSTFMLQEDVFFESLTVHETLHYAGMLRLPITWSRQEKKERVETVMASLGLTRVKDSLIGGQQARGISGK
jgi:ABC-type multidrug transport system ATPase subunit